MILKLKYTIKNNNSIGLKESFKSRHVEMESAETS